MTVTSFAPTVVERAKALMNFVTGLMSSWQGPVQGRALWVCENASPR